MADGKCRPVVIIGWSDFGQKQPSTIVVVPITSHGDGGRRQPGELPLADPQSSGLSDNSVVRPHSIIALHPNSMLLDEDPVGKLSDSEFGAVVSAIGQMFMTVGSYAQA